MTIRPEIAVALLLGITAGTGLACYVLNRRVRALTSTLAVLAALAAFVLGIAVFRAGGIGAGAPKFSIMSYALRITDSAALAFDLRITCFSGLIVLGTTFFALLTVVYSLRYCRRQEQLGKYYAYMLWTVTGASLAALSNNLLLLLLAWEFVTLMLYLLVGLGRHGAPEGSAKTFAMLGVADGALLLGIVLLCFGAGRPLALDSYSDGSILLGYGPAALFNYAVYFLFMIGAITKAGAMPLHTWIPAASEEAPVSVMAFLPAALDKLLGIYLLALISLTMFTLDDPTQLVLMIIGGVTIVFAVMMAMVQHDLRRLLSYHAVSQVGYMVLGIGTGTVVGIAGGLFHMVNNAIYKSCLFMGVGAVQDRTDETKVDKLGGLAGAMPVTFAGMFVAAMAISGVPPFNGFVSKWMIYLGTLEFGPRGIIFLVAAVFGSALTLASFVKVLHAMFFGPKPEGMKEERAGAGGRFALAGPVAILAVLCIVFGVAAQIPLQQLIAPAMQSLGVDLRTPDGSALTGTTGPLDFAKGLWSPGVATLLILLGVVGGLVVFFIGRGSKVRMVPPYLAAEKIGGDEARYGGTNFYKTVEDLPYIRTVYRDAEGGVYDLYYLGGKYGDTVVRLLKRFHSGQLPVYIAWAIMGFVGIVWYLLRAS